MVKTLLIAALASCAWASDSAIATFEHGEFEFRDLQPWCFFEVVALRVDGVSGTATNRTNSGWLNARFMVTMTLEDGTVRQREIRISSLPELSSDVAFQFSFSMEKTTQIPTVKEWRFHFIGGRRIVSEEQAEIEKAQKLEAADRARQQAAAASARIKSELARLPTLGGTERVFVGSDKKCADEFAEALKSEGLALRKKIAELLTYNCGFLVPRGTHVRTDAADGQHSFVTIAEGSTAGKSGWVLSKFVIRAGASTH